MNTRTIEIYPHGFYDIIKRHAHQTPDKTAVCSNEISMSYKKFFELCTTTAIQIQSELQVFNKNVTFVPIVLDRSYQTPIVIHGLQFLNKAYVPIDPHLPEERLKYLLENIDSPIVITQTEHKQKLQSLTESKVLTYEDLTKEVVLEEFLPTQFSSEDPSYMIYTSGTTGQPKGVVNLHKGLMNRITWMRDYYEITPDCNFLLKTPYTFDVSVWELTLPFLAGATLVVGGPKIHLKINELIRTIEKFNVTDVHFVPSVFQIFLEFLNQKTLDSLQRIYCSGEALSTELTKKYFESNLKASLHNLYGPTECAIDVSAWKCSQDDIINYSSTPIGKPIWNTYFYVVNNENKVVSPGEKGELLIGGVGVAQGYFKNLELTHERFVEDPIDPQQGKMYRSGDLVLKNKNDEYEFFGRLDFQVKINGQRVELGEIESHLLRIDGVKKAAVFYEQGQLIAFIESQQCGDIAVLKSILENYLPTYMVPTGFTVLEEFPLNSSGKIDRNKLKSLI